MGCSHFLIDWIDPSGLAMSPEECKRPLKQITALGWALAKEIAKYDPIADGRGGWPMKWGTGATKPGGHFNEMASYALEIANRAALYWTNCRNCDGNPPIPRWIWDKVKANATFYSALAYLGIWFKHEFHLRSSRRSGNGQKASL